MRSAGGAKSAPPSVVTRATKSVIAFFAAPSFQEGNGAADCAIAAAESAATNRSARKPTRTDMELVLDQRLFAPTVVILSMASLTVKLAALARGGNSLKLSRYFATMACAGTNTNARCTCQFA